MLNTWRDIASREKQQSHRCWRQKKNMIVFTESAYFKLF